jgi:putative transposase
VRTLSAHLPDLPKETPIEIWFQDEARIGQKNGLVRQWARRGSRPRQPADQRYESAYLFGAICPARGKGAALALPVADTFAMQLHLDEISRHIADGAHAVLLLDRAGWHTTGKLRMPANITPILLPSRAPELNPVENIWQYMRANWLSNRVFETYDVIIDAACQAWRKLIAQTGNHHINRFARLGPYRSVPMTLGINPSGSRLKCALWSLLSALFSSASEK